jgi:hypothetical protein
MLPPKVGQQACQTNHCFEHGEPRDCSGGCIPCRGLCEVAKFTRRDQGHSGPALSIVVIWQESCWLTGLSLTVVCRESAGDHSRGSVWRV